MQGYYLETNTNSGDRRRVKGVDINVNGGIHIAESFPNNIITESNNTRGFWFIPKFQFLENNLENILFRSAYYAAGSRFCVEFAEISSTGGERIFMSNTSTSMKSIGLLEDKNGDIYTIGLNVGVSPRKIHISKFSKSTIPGRGSTQAYVSYPNNRGCSYEKTIEVTSDIDVNSSSTTAAWDDDQENIIITTEKGIIIKYDIRGIVNPEFLGAKVEEIFSYSHPTVLTGSTWVFGGTPSQSSPINPDSLGFIGDGGSNNSNLWVRPEYTSITSSNLIIGLLGNKVYRGVDVVLTDTTNSIKSTYSVSSGDNWQAVVRHGIWNDSFTKVAPYQSFDFAPTAVSLSKLDIAVQPETNQVIGFTPILTWYSTGGGAGVDTANSGIELYVVGNDGSYVDSKIYEYESIIDVKVECDGGANVFVQYNRSGAEGINQLGGQNDYTLTKYNPALETAWTKVIGTPGYNGPVNMVPDKFGGCFSLIHDNTLTPDPSYVVAISSSGTKRWEKRFDSQIGLQVIHIAVDSLNRLVFLCRDSIGAQVVIVTDREGELVWQSSSRNRDPLPSRGYIIPANEGQLYVFSNDKSAEGSKDYTIDKLIITKYAADGEILWARRHVQSGRTKSSLMDVVPSGFATRDGSVFYLTNNNDQLPSSSEATALFVHRVDPNGNLIESKQISGAVQSFLRPKIHSDGKDMILSYITYIGSTTSVNQNKQHVTSVFRFPFSGDVGVSQTGVGVFDRSVANDTFEIVSDGNSATTITDINEFMIPSTDIPIVNQTLRSFDRFKTEVDTYSTFII